MAVRPVFTVSEADAIRFTVLTEFTWNGGFAVSQSRKNIAALHESYHRFYPDHRLLEISSKSESELGRALSAFNLTLITPSGAENTVECFYQAGKVFEHGGPYIDLLNGTSRQAKRDERLKSSGAVIGFELEGISFPARPITLYYEWLYLNALEQHPDLADALMEYDGFTDIAFNQARGNACQAQACAVYAALRRHGKLSDAMASPEVYASIAFSKPETVISHSVTGVSTPTPEEAPPKPKEPAIHTGCRLVHPVYGEGEVANMAGGVATVNFSGTEKKLSCSWLEQHCNLMGA